MEAKHQKVVGAYTFLKDLGKGQFGEVSLCCKTDNPAEQYAIKVIDKKMLASNAKLRELFKTEVKIMKFITHPNVVHCYDFLETDSRYYLIIEFCNNGDLEGHIDKQPNKRLEEDEAIYFLAQIMTGFRKLHENNVIHRDFKPANVFLNNDTLLIGDFGMAKETHDKAGTVCGTPQTMAPEILGGGARTGPTEYDNRADLWSIGVTLFMMLCGAEGPFNTSSMENLNSDIQRYSGENLRFPHGVELTNECKTLLRSLLQPDPDRRITWYDFFHHPIFPINRKKAKLLRKPTSVAFSNFDLNYERFDQDMERVTLPPTGQQNLGKPPSPSPTPPRNEPKQEQPKPSVGVNAPAKEKPKEEKAACCRIF